MKRCIITVFVIVVLCQTMAWAKVDLVTLPSREAVQMTIYNSADLTLVSESRFLTLKQGLNKLQFSWANTLIDPTSLETIPLQQADQIDIADLTYPPRVRELGLWNIQSRISGKVPVEISYLTSGLSWRAFYLCTLTPDEKTMQLQGYVRVTNNSGEDYENAQVRLIVGQVHILDEIAALAQRAYPYDQPGLPPPSAEPSPAAAAPPAVELQMEASRELTELVSKPKEIKKEGLSEYFLYTIEGTETVPTGWSKRLPSFTAGEVPVVNLYRYDEELYGKAVVRFLSFKNDQEHQLGQTPIPGGTLKVYRTADAEHHLSYEGQSSFKYIPVDEDVELNLDAVANVVVAPVLMDYQTENYRFDNHLNVCGWDEIRTFAIEVKNTRDIAVRVEIKRHFGTSYWDLKKDGPFGDFEEMDKDTVKFTLTLEPRSTQKFSYVLTTYQGKRQEEKNKQ